MPFALVVAINALACGQVPEATPEQPEASSVMVVEPTPRAISDLSNDELIARLPPARQERAWDEATGSVIDSEAANEWAKRVAAKKFTRDEFSQAVRACGMLRSSPTCFENEPYHVWFRMPTWLWGHVAVARPVLAAFADAKAPERIRHGCGMVSAYEEERESFQAIGILPPESTEVQFEILISPSEVWEGAEITETVRVTLPVRIVAKAEPEPVDGPEVTRAVAEAMVIFCSPGLFWRDPSVHLFTQFLRPLNGPLVETLVSLQIEILKDDQVVFTHCIPDPDDEYGDLELASFASIHDGLARDIIRRKEIDRYSVRVRGVKPQTSNQWCRTQYWSGSITLPLGVVRDAKSGIRPAGPMVPQGKVEKE